MGSDAECWAHLQEQLKGLRSHVQDLAEKQVPSTRAGAKAAAGAADATVESSVKTAVACATGPGVEEASNPSYTPPASVMSSRASGNSAGTGSKRRVNPPSSSAEKPSAGLQLRTNNGPFGSHSALRSDAMLRLKRALSQPGAIRGQGDSAANADRFPPDRLAGHPQGASRHADQVAAPRESTSSTVVRPAAVSRMVGDGTSPSMPQELVARAPHTADASTRAVARGGVSPVRMRDPQTMPASMWTPRDGVVAGGLCGMRQPTNGRIMQVPARPRSAGRGACPQAAQTPPAAIHGGCSAACQWPGRY